jgi:hypothetical protein
VLPSFLDLAPDLHGVDADRGATFAGDEEFGTGPLSSGTRVAGLLMPFSPLPKDMVEPQSGQGLSMSSANESCSRQLFLEFVSEDSSPTSFILVFLCAA